MTNEVVSACNNSTDHSDTQKVDEGFDSSAFLKTLTVKPGVYQMFDRKGDILYVGKAKNLKNRVSSYFRASGHGVKTQVLVQKIADISVTVTRSETEALLLEQNLIKSLKPPYNILLRDDKSYPYIFISDKDEYPALRFHRGARKRSGRYFGPFPSGTAVRDSLNLMQKLFKVRQCEDSFYRNRTRPCLQYQINRCTAPCVKAISRSDYADDIRHTMLFLEGKSQAVLRELGDQMEQASAQLNFEQAAILRDQIISMQKVQEQQGVEGSAGEADIIGCAMKSGAACVHMLFVRGGRIIGSKVFHPKPSLEESTNELTSAFIAQWYLSADREIPPQVIVHAMPHDQGILSDALQQKRGRQTAVVSSVRGDRASWLKLAQSNAEQQLDTALANKKHVYARYLDLQQILELEKVPQRMECFDISHSSGEATVASCVVFDRNGPLKSDYRRFNITGITEGDDYAAMHQALTRRYQRIKKEDAKLPDVLVIDGGKGQITQAMDVLSSLALDSVTVIGIAKGPTRKAGFEVLINGLTGEEIVPKSDSAGLHLLQHIRDESHRFAITGHRAKRGKARKKSVLEDIEGIGPKRRRELLKHFGGLPEVERASVEEIAKVSSISRTLAESIYEALHPDVS